MSIQDPNTGGLRPGSEDGHSQAEDCSKVQDAGPQGTIFSKQVNHNDDFITGGCGSSSLNGHGADGRDLNTMKDKDDAPTLTTAESCIGLGNDDVSTSHHDSQDFKADDDEKRRAMDDTAKSISAPKTETANGVAGEQKSATAAKKASVVSVSFHPRCTLIPRGRGVSKVPPGDGPREDGDGEDDGEAEAAEDESRFDDDEEVDRERDGRQDGAMDDTQSSAGLAIGKGSATASVASSSTGVNGNDTNTLAGQSALTYGADSREARPFSAATPSTRSRARSGSGSRSPSGRKESAEIEQTPNGNNSGNATTTGANQVGSRPKLGLKR